MEILIIAIIGALVGALIGKSKGRTAEGAVFGLLLGPIGWLIIALVGSQGLRKCPFCAMEVKSEAVVCRYCGRDIPPPNPATVLIAAGVASGQDVSEDLERLSEKSKPISLRTKIWTLIIVALVVVVVVLLLTPVDRSKAALKQTIYFPDGTPTLYVGTKVEVLSWDGSYVHIRYEGRELRVPSSAIPESAIPEFR